MRVSLSGSFVNGHWVVGSTSFISHMHFKIEISWEQKAETKIEYRIDLEDFLCQVE